MSCAKNHTKRSHRSEGLKRAIFSTTSRRAWVRKENRPQRLGIFSRIAKMMQRPKEINK